MLKPVIQPAPIRILNATGALLRSLGIPLVRLTPQALKARATRLEGLTDFGDPDFEEPLAILCASAEKDARLSLGGRLTFRDHVTNALVTRLRRIEMKKRRPESFETPLIPPLIILGLPRSGTTLLHRLLSLAEDAFAPPLWLLQRPLPGSGADHRREETVRQVAQMKRAAPDLDAKHHVDADEPEEDVFLLDSSLWSPSFWMMHPVYEYLDRYLAHDQHVAYQVYREHLALLQTDNPGKRLTLKAPVHTGNIELLLDAVPEALIVQTHRDPVTVTSSTNSLFYTIHGYVSEKVDVLRMAKQNLKLLVEMTERNMDARANIPSGRIFDLSYDDLTADPLGSVHQIYDHFGLGFDEGFERRLKGWLEKRPKGKFGKHEYSAEEFGLTDAQISERFKLYTSRFLKA